MLIESKSLTILTSSICRTSRHLRTLPFNLAWHNAYRPPTGAPADNDLPEELLSLDGSPANYQILYQHLASSYHCPYCSPLPRSQSRPEPISQIPRGVAKISPTTLPTVILQGAANNPSRTRRAARKIPLIERPTRRSGQYVTRVLVLLCHHTLGYR